MSAFVALAILSVILANLTQGAAHAELSEIEPPALDLTQTSVVPALIAN
jgi:hypothetical protein